MINCLKRLTVLFLMVACGIAYIGMYSSAEAKVIERIEGIDYLQGDLNYPFFSEGSRGGDAADISSVYIKTKNREWIQYVFTAVNVMYESGETHTYTKSIWENLDNGGIYIDSQDNPTNGLPPSMFYRKTFILIRDAAFNHMR